MSDTSTPEGVKTAEQKRLEDKEAGWKRWGPYLSERQWGTVREDYSADGNAWNYFTHDHARSRAYHWGEDGIAGFSDDKQRQCFAVALWNEKDPILKERLFGLTNSEGNHGEDVKEYYFYLDATPTNSYLKYLYKYPQNAFPYDDLVAYQSAQRGRTDPEYELIDTGVFNDDRYFDVLVEYAKAAPDDILIKISVSNRGTGFSTAARAADLLVPQYVGMVAGSAKARSAGGQWHDRGIIGSQSALRCACAAAVHRERDQQPTPLRHRQCIALCQGWHQRFRGVGKAGARSIQARREPRQPHIIMPPLMPATQP